VNVRFDAEAEAELAAAFDWYEERGHRGLGERFIGCVDEAIVRIVETPRSFSVVMREGEVDVRRVLVRDFPYQLLFVEAGAPGGIELLVVAVAHLHRDPDYWKGRARPQREDR
jgi:hypothetical protein